MPHKILHIDYETKSTCFLKKRGLSVYAKDPPTDIWCAAYAFDDEEVKLWTPDQEVPREIIDHICAGHDVYAHNAAFEIAITNEIAAPRYGWPYISLAQTHCTMAMAFSMGLPGSLEKAAAALAVDKQKDMAGSRLMMQMAQPREIIEHPEPNFMPGAINYYGPQIIWWDDEEKLQRLYDYCRQDIEVERALTKRLLLLSQNEREVWRMDQEINNRGIMVDIPAAKKALEIVNSEKERLNEKMRKVTKNQVATCNANVQITRYLRENFEVGFSLAVDTIGKADVAVLLDRPDIPPSPEKCSYCAKKQPKTPPPNSNR